MILINLKTLTCYEYKRNVFSYYEKINFVLELSKKYKERITFIDTDGLDDYNTDFIFDDRTFYTFHVWKLIMRLIMQNHIF